MALYLVRVPSFELIPCTFSVRPWFSSSGIGAIVLGNGYKDYYSYVLYVDVLKRSQIPTRLLTIHSLCDAGKKKRCPVI